jgi:hypothetical protein
MCIVFNGTYTTTANENTKYLDDIHFNELQRKILYNEYIHPLNIDNINMTGFYQTDLMHNQFKHKVFQFIHQNPSHIIVTDGITAGDGKRETFRMIDIITLPANFNKIYKNVLHIRLEDFVTHGFYISKEHIIKLIDTLTELEDLCIVCKQPITPFEINYIEFIHKYLTERKICVILEHNDVLTDFYILKESTLLICSNSTLSWCAALFSSTLKTCYIPHNDRFKHSIVGAHFY